MRRFLPLLPFFGIVVMTAIADQVTKLWALSALRENVPVTLAPFLSLTLGFNTGISFGVFSGNGETTHVTLVTITSVITAMFAWYAVRAPANERLGLGLIVGGALGNLIDRYVRGKVTDFIDVHAGGWHWPSFNLADTFITLGVVFVVAVNLRPEPNRSAGE